MRASSVNLALAKLACISINLKFNGSLVPPLLKGIL